VPRELRAALAAHWLREAGCEHASIASFARASLELLALGAPPDLLHATHQAAGDEIAHARLAFALASAYAGSPVGPGALPVGALDTGAISFARVARAVLLDACANEAVAAATARAASEVAVDPAVKRALARIADDEERHAALAWRTLAWLARTGGAPVIAELRAAIAGEAASDPPAGEEGEDLSEHGVLGERALAAIRRAVIDEVVTPCAVALIAAAAEGAAEPTAFSRAGRDPGASSAGARSRSGARVRPGR
jgi:hypothetical protein